MPSGCSSSLVIENRFCAFSPCGEAFSPKQKHQRYCSPNHRKYATSQRRSLPRETTATVKTLSRKIIEMDEKLDLILSVLMNR